MPRVQAGRVQRALAGVEWELRMAAARGADFGEALDHVVRKRLAGLVDRRLLPSVVEAARGGRAYAATAERAVRAARTRGPYPPPGHARAVAERNRRAVSRSIPLMLMLGLGVSPREAYRVRLSGVRLTGTACEADLPSRQTASGDLGWMAAPMARRLAEARRAGQAFSGVQGGEARLPMHGYVFGLTLAALDVSGMPAYGWEEVALSAGGLLAPTPRPRPPRMPAWLARAARRRSASRARAARRRAIRLREARALRAGVVAADVAAAAARRAQRLDFVALPENAGHVVAKRNARRAAAAAVRQVAGGLVQDWGDG